jgi:hypothetical protein
VSIVSKNWLDLCWQDKIERLANSGEAIAAWLDRVDPAILACEPTGGYERALLAALRERGIPFLRVHPNQLVAFRDSRSIKAKTDRIDARLILAFLIDVLARRELRPGVVAATLIADCPNWAFCPASRSPRSSDWRRAPAKPARPAIARASATAAPGCAARCSMLPAAPSPILRRSATSTTGWCTQTAGRQGRAGRGDAQNPHHRQCRRPRSPALARRRALADRRRHIVPTA